MNYWTKMLLWIVPVVAVGVVIDRLLIPVSWKSTWGFFLGMVCMLGLSMIERDR